MIPIIWPDNTPAEVSVERWQKLLEIWDQHIQSGIVGAVALNFLSSGEMRQLNSQHAGKDEPTDVLSFRYDPPLKDESGEVVAGEIVVCPEIARAFARQHGLTIENEYATLFVHGLLHLAGWDHATATERHRYAEVTRDIMEQGGYQAVSLWLD